MPLFILLLPVISVMAIRPIFDSIRSDPVKIAYFDPIFDPISDPQKLAKSPTLLSPTLLLYPPNVGFFNPSVLYNPRGGT